MDERQDPLERLTKEEIRDLVGKGWLTHDGMWFVNAAREFGIARANALNRSAIRAMSQLEVRRLVEALGVEVGALTTSRAVGRFITDGLSVLVPESVSSRIRMSTPDPATIRVEWEPGECFAYKGMKRAGLLEEYECGVIYRIGCWLEALGIRHELDPPAGRCRMKAGGACTSEIHLEVAT